MELGKDGAKFKIGASNDEDVHVLVIAGVAINEPIARYGPFVMNTRQEIQQAFLDYHTGKLGEIEGSDERYEKTREAVAKQKKTGKYYERKEL